MKNCYKLIVNILLCLSVLSCTNKLEVNSAFDIPEDFALKTPLDCENAIISTYTSMASEYCLGGSMHTLPDIMADAIVPSTTQTQDDLDFYNWNISNTHPIVTKMWADAYTAINRANNIIDALENNKIAITDSTRGNMKRVLAEAYFIRAVMHFELVRLFAPQYQPGSGDRAIPLMLKPTTEREVPSYATVSQVYNQVEADLKKIIDVNQFSDVDFPLEYGNPVTPPAQKNKVYFGRATKTAARAYLAKVNFQKGTTDGYQQTLDLTNEIVLSGKYALINYSNINLFSTSQDSKAGAGGTYETIFNIINATPAVGVQISGRIYSTNYVPLKYAKTQSGVASLSNPQYLLTDNFYNNYPKCVKLPYQNSRMKISDQRFNGGANGFIFKDVNTNLIYGNKYTAFGKNLIKVRYAELLLNRAEINAMNNNLTDAIADLRIVRRRAFGNFNALDVNNLNSLTQTELIEEIQYERIRELCLEGDRLHDLRRRKVDIPFGSRSVTTDLPWNSSRLILPIPATESSLK